MITAEEAARLVNENRKRVFDDLAPTYKNLDSEIRKSISHHEHVLMWEWVDYSTDTLFRDEVVAHLRRLGYKVALCGATLRIEW